MKDKMLIRLTKDSFVRNYSNVGYISNQLTKHDRVYNDTGADFLMSLSRVPKDIDEIVIELFRLYKEISIEELKADFLEFVNDLEREWFLVIGNSPSELNKKEPTFSYKSENPKTAVYNFSNPDSKDVLTDSANFLHEEFHQNPQILALQIEITPRCNERCIHCYLPNSKKDIGRDMESDLVLRVLDEAKAMGTLQVTFSGGELFLHSEISTFLRHAHKNDFSISILSNLVLLTNEHISVLKEINPSLVQVSLYSMIAEEHDAITKVKGSFAKTINSIERLVAADIPVQISCPVMKINRKSYKNVLVYAKELRIKAQTDFIMMAQTDFNISNLSQRISLEETEELIKDILIYDKDYLNTILQQEPKSKDIEKYKKMPICGVGVDNICLSANGDYFPCAGWQGLSLGNALEKSLKDVWEDSSILKELRSISNSSFPTCIVCDARDYCAPCLVRNYNENKGDMYKIAKHYCDVAFMTKKMIEEYSIEQQKCNTLGQ